MEEGNLAILVDAKTEYTKQLVNILKNSLYLGIKEIYIESKEKCMENENDTLSVFQVNLSEIPKWNQDIINTKTDSVVKDSGCDWIEDLITAVFVSHTRILTSINFSKNKKKINLKIPKVDHFIHQCYVDVARYFWKNPYLYDDDIGSYEYQRNRREAENIIENSIGETIRKQLPVKHILKEYLGNEYNDEESGGEDDITKNIPEKYQENLRKMVQAEILQCSAEQQSQTQTQTQTPNADAEVESTPVSLDTQTDTTTEILEGVSDSVGDVVELNTTETNTEVATDLSNNDLTTTEDLNPVTEAPAPAPVVDTESELNLETTTNATDSTTTSVAVPETTEVSTTEPTKINLEPLSDELNLDNMINTELNSVKESDDLVVEELDLDMDDLSKLEEIYIDNPISSSSASTAPAASTESQSSGEGLEQPKNMTMKTEQIDLNEFSEEQSRSPSPSPSQSPAPEPPVTEKSEEVKTIVLDTNEDIKKQLKKKDYSFFDDADDS